MKVAVMQPYLFPYIGYYQLIASTDFFVVYDDVNFIKQGWINRNQILVNSKPLIFSLPLKDQSSFNLICETKIDEIKYSKWKNKFYKTLEQNYRKAKNFNEGLITVKAVLDIETDSISQFAYESLVRVCSYIGIPFNHAKSSEEFRYIKSKASERVREICQSLKTSVYVNPPGGVSLYKREDFENFGIELKFLKPAIRPYSQFNNPFISHLSIIDVLMFNTPAEIKSLLGEWNLQ